MKKIRLLILFYLFLIILRDFYTLYENAFGLCLCYDDLSVIPILFAPIYLIYFISRLKGTFSLDLFSKIFIISIFFQPIFYHYYQFGSLEYYTGWGELIFSLPLIFYLFFPNKLQRLTFLTFGFSFLSNLIFLITIYIPLVLDSGERELFSSTGVKIISIILNISFLAISFEFLSYLSKKLNRSPFVRLGDLLLLTIVAPLFYFIYLWINLEDHELSNLLDSSGAGFLPYILLHCVFLILFITFSLKRLSLQFKSISSEIAINGIKVIGAGKNLIFYSYSILISVLVSIVLIVLSNNVSSLDTLQFISKLSSVSQILLLIAIIFFLSSATYNFLTSDIIEQNSQQGVNVKILDRISNLLKQLFWAFIPFSVLIVFYSLISIKGLFRSRYVYIDVDFNSSDMTVPSILLLIMNMFLIFKLYQIGKVCSNIEKVTD